MRRLAVLFVALCMTNPVFAPGNYKRDLNEYYQTNRLAIGPPGDENYYNCWIVGYEDKLEHDHVIVDTGGGPHSMAVKQLRRIAGLDAHNVDPNAILDDTNRHYVHRAMADEIYDIFGPNSVDHHLSVFSLFFYEGENIPLQKEILDQYYQTLREGGSAWISLPKYHPFFRRAYMQYGKFIPESAGPYGTRLIKCLPKRKKGKKRHGRIRITVSKRSQPTPFLDFMLRNSKMSALKHVPIAGDVASICTDPAEFVIEGTVGTMSTRLACTATSATFMTGLGSLVAGSAGGPAAMFITTELADQEMDPLTMTHDDWQMALIRDPDYWWPVVPQKYKDRDWYMLTILGEEKWEELKSRDYSQPDSELNRSPINRFGGSR